jgi:hypothetical protein
MLLLLLLRALLALLTGGALCTRQQLASEAAKPLELQTPTLWHMQRQRMPAMAATLLLLLLLLLLGHAVEAGVTRHAWLTLLLCQHVLL